MQSAERSASSTTRSCERISIRGRARLGVIAVVAAAAAAAITLAIGSDTHSKVEAWSVSTAYVAFLLLAMSMLVGPLNVIRRSPNPVHSGLRRDIGVAGGSFALIHAIFGLQVHMGGSIRRYFTLPGAATNSDTLFVATNYLGLVSAAVLIVLVAISTDVAIRRIGLARWKGIQRFAYWAVGASVAHGVTYQLIEKRTFWLIGLIAATAAAIIAFQLRGIMVRLTELTTQRNNSPV